MPRWPAKTVDLDEVDFDDDETPVPVRRKPGRPAKSQIKGRGTETTITKRELVEEEDDKPVINTFTSLFDAGGDERQVIKVRVTRKEPHEGMLGYLEDRNATEADIFERWGGSVYRLDALDGQGRIVTSSSIKLAGDPIFVSASATMQWRQQRGLPPIGAAPAGEQMSLKEMLQLMDQKEEKRRTEERERAERERAEREEREERRRREDREFQQERERQTRDWEAKKRADDDERQRRQREEDARTEERRRQSIDEATRQQQQFMAQMLTIVQQQASQSISFVKETLTQQNAAPKTDPSDMLLKGVTLALQLKEAAGGSGESEDLLTTVVKNLPDMLSSAGGAIGSAIREVRGAPQQQAAFSMNGPAGQKLAALANQIQQRGGNPEQALGTIADRLLTSGAPKPKQGETGTTPPANVPVNPRAVVFDVPPEQPVQAVQAPELPEVTTGDPQPAPQSIRLKFPVSKPQTS